MMFIRHNFILLLVASIATPGLAANMPRQDSSSSSPTASVTSAPSTDISSSAVPAHTSSVTAQSQLISFASGGSIVTVSPTGTVSEPIPTGFSNSTQGLNSSVTNPPACSSDTYALDGAPFCLPANGSKWIQETSYPITWDPAFWPGYNGNVTIALLYIGPDGSLQDVITQNNEIVNQRGLFIIDIQKSWLNGDSVVGARLLIAPNDFTSENAGAHNGPIVTLQDSATPFDKTPPKFNSHDLAVVIAVPVSVFVFIVFSFGVCWFTRKQRRVPDEIYIPRSGRRWKKGYADGRSRRRRAGVEKSNDEFELGTVSGYRDEPSEVYHDVAPENTRTVHE